jgi:hypothetical protein
MSAVNEACSAEDESAYPKNEKELIQAIKAMGIALPDDMIRCGACGNIICAANRCPYCEE